MRIESSDKIIMSQSGEFVYLVRSNILGEDYKENTKKMNFHELVNLREEFNLSIQNEKEYKDNWLECSSIEETILFRNKLNGYIAYLEDNYKIEIDNSLKII